MVVCVDENIRSSTTAAGASSFTNQWDAKDYANNSSGQLGLAEELIGKLDLQAGQSVLDIGCGDGKITHALAVRSKTGRVTGIDQSQNFIDHANENHRRENLNFLCMDAQQIKLAHRYDWVFSNAALHWVPDQLAVLRGIGSILKPGGNIILQMGGAGNADALIKVISSVQQRSEWRQYFADFSFPYTFPSVEQYQEWLSTVGFKVKRIDLLDRSMKYSSVEKFAAWLRSAWFPMADPLPATLKTLFINQVVDAFLSQQGTSQTLAETDVEVDLHGKSIDVGMKRLELEASFAIDS